MGPWLRQKKIERVARNISRASLSRVFPRIHQSRLRPSQVDRPTFHDRDFRSGAALSVSSDAGLFTDTPCNSLRLYGAFGLFKKADFGSFRGAVPGTGRRQDIRRFRPRDVFGQRQGKTCLWTLRGGPAPKLFPFRFLGCNPGFFSGRPCS